MKFSTPAVSFFLFTAKHASSFAVAPRPSKRGFLTSKSSLVRDVARNGAMSCAAVHSHSLHHAAGIFRRGGTNRKPKVSSSLSLLTKIPTTSSSLSMSTTAEPATAPVEIFRKDYQPLPYTVSSVEMDFSLRPGKTTVKTQLTLERNPVVADAPLVLDGDETSVKLLDISMNGLPLKEGVDYTMGPGKLVIEKPTDGAVISTTVEIVPEKNTQLSGLYTSGDSMYCTQCEAMGFRRITYYPDRPDNMAVFERVRLEADQENYPVLLSNGNLIEEGVVDGVDPETGRPRHYKVWKDPFRKPSYLFAAVAGNLKSIQDTFTTKSGREVKLAIFSEPRNVEKLHYAMDSLKRSMKWDEETYGLEYDLDLYNIVAVESFNMGAMENKGLNVFNTAYVLADPKTATDVDYERVEGVIAHEYFHNWTGNRVTCRDWFQLTLKEGLTVFRDQEFSGDMNSKAVKRIEDIRSLRGAQFREDAGPMKHPIRPESYISMDNFYTSTVYIKGAEIIRMYQTLLTKSGFRKGMDLYFERHDGSAVTCDDFLAAMGDANGVDLSQFALWYETPGTPTVKYSTKYEPDSGTFTLTLTQSSLSERPLLIPIAAGLLDKATGEEVVPTTVLQLKEATQTFTFDNLKGEVVPSLLREFSAPVKLQPESGEVDEAEMAFLAANDTDGFNRWEAGQRMYTILIFQVLKGEANEQTLEYVMEAFGRILSDESTTDFSSQAYGLILPSEGTLVEEMEVMDPIGIHKARGDVKKMIARKYEDLLRSRYEKLTEAMASEDGEFKVDASAIGRRRLRNVLLEYLCAIRETPEERVAAAELASSHFKKATGMSDKMAALTALASMDQEGAAARDEALEQFYNDAEGDSLVLNKWFTVQALADLPDVLDRVKKLTEHPDFTLLNPNRFRSLVSAFTMNAAAFHQESGAAYEFIGGILVEIDKVNPQVSSRLARSLINWRRFDEKRGGMMKAELEKLSQLSLSKDLYEIVSRGLQ